MPDSNYRIVTDANAINRAQWQRFVFAHPQGNIFQTPQMYDAYRTTKNYQPVVVACLQKDTLVGILLAVVQKESTGILGRLSARSIIWGGPLIEKQDGEIADLILHAYDQRIAKNAIYGQFRNLSDISWTKPIFRDAGYRFEDHLNIHIDLSKSETELWMGIHSKRRNEIRRAYKEKTTFSVHADGDSVTSGYEILSEVYRYAKLPFPDRTLFQSVLSQSTEDFGLKIFTATNQDTMIGVMFALVFKNRIYDWYAGAYRDSLTKYPNDLIPWEAMKWGRARGFTVFDFGGAGKPDIPYGVRDFKLKFGGELVNFGRFEKIYQPLRMNLAKAGFRVWQTVIK